VHQKRGHTLIGNASTLVAHEAEAVSVAAWSDVGLAAVGGAIGIVSSYLTIKLQRRYAQEDRDADDRAARAVRIGEVLGPIQTLLIDITPERVAFEVTGVIRAERQKRWLPLREELEVVRVVEPSADLRQTMRDLEVAIENVFHWVVLTSSAHAPPDAVDKATEHHKRATDAVDAILRSLHEDRPFDQAGVGDGV